MFLSPTQLSATWATPTLMVVSTLTYYACWRWSERARARRTAKIGRTGSSSLPSPAALLPRWLPFLGGHTLQMDFEKVNYPGIDVLSILILKSSLALNPHVPSLC